MCSQDFPFSGPHGDTAPLQSLDVRIRMINVKNWVSEYSAKLVRVPAVELFESFQIASGASYPASQPLCRPGPI